MKEYKNYCFYFKLHEMDLGLTEALTGPELACDVACLLYDVTNPRSFEYCAKIYKVCFVAEYFLNTLFKTFFSFR